MLHQIQEQIAIARSLLNLSPAAKMSSSLNCRLLHIKVLSICSKFGRNIGQVANSFEPDLTYSVPVPSCMQRPYKPEQQEKEGLIKPQTRMICKN